MSEIPAHALDGLLTWLHEMPPRERIRLARTLAKDVGAIIAADTDTLIYQATRTATFAQVGGDLDLSPKQVQRAVEMYHLRLRRARHQPTEGTPS